MDDASASDEAVVGPERLHPAAARTAAALHAAGLRPGDVLALMVRNEPVVLELLLAARRLGVRCCPVNGHLGPEEAAAIVATAGARTLVAHADLADRVRAALPGGVRVFTVEPSARTRRLARLPPAVPGGEPGVDDWAAWRDAHGDGPAPESPIPGAPLFFTSGTTGRPRGVRFLPPTPAQVAGMMASAGIGYGLQPGARVLVGAPLHHSGPCHMATIAALMGCTLVVEPRFDPLETLRLIEAHRITHLYLVPTMYVRLLRVPPGEAARHDLSSVRFVASTGSPCPPEVKQRMIDWWGPVFHECYGASELGLITHADSDDALRRPGTVGRPLPGVRIEIVDDAGRRLGPGEVGLVCVRSGSMPDFTYLGDDGARAAADRDGAVTLGDLGYLDEGGYLFLVDRRADVVNSGGTKVHTAEVEGVLAAMPEVADCAVYGVPDAEFGEAVEAAVQLAPGAAPTADAVRAWVRARLAGFKVPRSVVFVEALPREDTGKLFKRRLREAAVAREARRG